MNQLQQYSQEPSPADMNIMELQARLRGGNPAQKIERTVDNYLYILSNDKTFESVRFNVLTDRAEICDDDGYGEPTVRRWKDSDEAYAYMHIERYYGLNSVSNFQMAVKIFFTQREYNPLVERISAIEWDGQNRIEEFLIKWGLCEDNEYNREVSRLIFAGGINRAYRPGCKFDDVPILIGKQGMGKSSLVRFLCMDDEFFGEISELDGVQAIEQLEGKWICEMAELAAFSKKDQETAKAFITRTVDHYRRPYARYVDDIPRRSIIIATANDHNPLIDKTGNRRYYPVEIGIKDKFWLYNHEAECREYVAQCWAEAKARFMKNEMPCFAKPELVAVYEQKQEEAMREDYREGLIIAYLEGKAVGECVCTLELAREALANGELPEKMTTASSRDIGMIMDKMRGWERVGPRRFTTYGRQRAWQKTEVYLEDAETEGEDDAPW